MPDPLKPPSSSVNGRLWGVRARDWAEIQEPATAALYDPVLDEMDVQAGTRLLDLGCGAGLGARLAADRGAIVSGIDAAEPLLAFARQRTPSGDFRVADLEALPFADHVFDAVTSFNAVQYAANPALALAEARRVTQRGGTVAIVVWGDPANMPMASIIAALGALLPPPPPGAGGPFALSGEGALRNLAYAGGLDPLRIVDIALPFLYPDLETALRGLNASGVAARAMALAGEAAVKKAHTHALGPFAGRDGGYCIAASFRCLIAQA